MLILSASVHIDRELLNWVIVWCIDLSNYRTNALLEDFCESSDHEYFYTCMWECVLSCPSARLSAITFLLAHYNKKRTMEDQLFMMGLNIDLMVSFYLDIEYKINMVFRVSSAICQISQ